MGATPTVKLWTTPALSSMPLSSDRTSVNDMSEKTEERWLGRKKNKQQQREKTDGGKKEEKKIK